MERRAWSCSKIGRYTEGRATLAPFHRDRVVAMMNKGSETDTSDCMTAQFSDAVLEAYLDESLESQRASAIEEALRDDESLVQRLARLVAQRDSGMHSLGAVWRRRQIGVPSREELGAFVLGTLDPDHEEYLRFRLDVLRCPFTRANLNDLQARQQARADDSEPRRRRYFQSSAGYLGKSS